MKMKNLSEIRSKEIQIERSNKSGVECWVVMKHLYPHQAAPNIRPERPQAVQCNSALQWNIVQYSGVWM